MGQRYLRLPQAMFLLLYQTQPRRNTLIAAEIITAFTKRNGILHL
jgi:hypothetical protein